MNKKEKFDSILAKLPPEKAAAVKNLIRARDKMIRSGLLLPYYPRGSKETPTKSGVSNTRRRLRFRKKSV